MFSRRELLRWWLGVRLPAYALASAEGLSAEDDQFLEELERASFLFFWEQADPHSGLVRDRCAVRGDDKRDVASIAATGFGLTALCIGHKRGYVPAAAATLRVIATLQFLWKSMPTHRGFYYHWANVNTGERVWDSEVSSIDTSILLCGVLTCREYFHHSGITNLANAIFGCVEWTWGSEDTALVSHGWTPEFGFLPYRWDSYSELMMVYLLGLGSAAYPLPETAWSAWKRTTFEYDGLRYIGSWGITASDSARGYIVWGGPPEIGPIDGTVVPSAVGGSLPFLPQPTLRVLKTIRNRYGAGAWTKYGFVNAFNPLKNWYDPDVIGIDTGITLVMAENLRDGFVWNTFMKAPEVQRGLRRAGFRQTTEVSSGK